MVSFINQTDKDYAIFREYLKEQYPDMNKYNGIKYTFFDILKIGDREKITEYLYDKCKRLWDEGESRENIGKSVAAHLHVYDKLVNSGHVQQDSTMIMLYRTRVSEDEEGKREYPYDLVDCYDVTDNTIYSLSFIPWNELLDYKVLEENLREIAVNDFIAACLYEMTFHGYEEETIQAKGYELLSRVEAYKRQLSK